MTMKIMFAQKNTPQEEQEELLNREFPGGQEEFIHIMKGIKKRRDAQNPEIAAAIKKHLHKGDSAVIVYGGGHFDGAWDLDEMIGERRVVTIALFPDRKRYNTVSGEESAHYIRINDEGSFFLSYNGQINKLLRFQPPDTQQPENPTLSAIISALRVPAPKR